METVIKDIKAVVASKARARRIRFRGGDPGSAKSPRADHPERCFPHTNSEADLTDAVIGRTLKRGAFPADFDKAK